MSSKETNSWIKSCFCCVSESEEDEGGRAIKLLLLGTGAAGKSTFIRNLQANYGRWDSNYKKKEAAFDEQTRRSYKHVVHSNIFKTIDALIQLKQQQGLEYVRPSSKRAAEMILNYLPSEPFYIRQDLEIDVRMAEYIESVWHDPTIQDVFKRRHTYPDPSQIADTVDYFMQRIKHISQPHYIPTVKDVLHCRKPTEGYQDYNFKIDGVSFSIRDIGGDKSQRVTAAEFIISFIRSQRANNDIVSVIFMVSLSDYNQRHPLHKDKTLLDESLRLFEVFVSCEDFKAMNFIVFLNKRDIFHSRLKTLKDYHMLGNDYPRGPSVRQERLFQWAEDQVIRKFQFAFSQARSQEVLFIKPTCATDTEIMPAIFTAARETIMTQVIMERFF